MKPLKAKKEISSTKIEPRNSIRDLFFICIICAALGVAAYLLFGEDGYFALQKKEAELRQLELESASRAETNRQLEERITDLRNDVRLIEKHAREEGKLAKEGDIILNTNQASSPSFPETSTTTLPANP
jgi:cell division protein FtsB